MKKTTVLLLLFVVLFTKSNSQITKGNWLAGGNLSYTNIKSKYTSTNNSTTNYLTITPNIGYFFIDKLAAGIKIDARFISTKYPQPDGTTNKTTQNDIGVGAFVRYYFLPTDKTINLVSDASLLYNTNSNSSTSVKSNSINYSVFGGPVIFFNSSVGLEFLIGYQHYKEVQAEYKSNTLQFKIGLQIHLEKK